ncbi:MAG TPA: hypothetical protein VIJ75_12010 [Hanamia sp.]
MKRVILLTATIEPVRDMIFTKLVDVDLRRKQYIDAIEFYLKMTDACILFIENSGTDISNFFIGNINYSRLEFLTYLESEDIKNLGKGFGEMRILEHAFKESKFIKNADFIYKITGRLIVKNINSFLKMAIKDHSEIIAIVDFKREFTFSNFFIFTPQFFMKFFISYKLVIDDKKNLFFEHALTYAICDLINCNGKIEFLNLLPQIKGYSGTSNKKIKIKYYWIKNYLKYKFFKNYLYKRYVFVRLN